MKSRIPAGIALVMLFVLPTSLFAAPEDVKFALHLKERTGGPHSMCGNWAPTDVPCSQYRTSARVGVGYDAFLVAAGGDEEHGLGGMSCGIYYDPEPGSGMDVFGWTLCAFAEYPNSGSWGEWPASGGGNRITWGTGTDCQTHSVGVEGLHVVAGAFYVYAYGEDVFQVTPNENLMSGSELAIATCPGDQINLSTSALGAIRFSDSGSVLGYNPCTGEGTPPDAPPPPGPPPPPPPPPPVPHGEVDATVFLHLVDPADARGASCDDAPSSLEGVVTSGDLTLGASGSPYYVYVLGTASVNGKTAGLTGFQFGIDYPQASGNGEGIEVLSWQSCTQVQVNMPSWPASGSGATLVWPLSDCQADEIIVAGFFYVSAYSPSTISIVGFPYTGEVKVADCTGEEVDPDIPVADQKLGWVSLGGGGRGTDTDGCNPAMEPCPKSATPVQAVSWGSLKQKFR